MNHLFSNHKNTSTNFLIGWKRFSILERPSPGGLASVRLAGLGLLLRFSVKGAQLRHNVQVESTIVPFYNQTLKAVAFKPGSSSPAHFGEYPQSRENAGCSLRHLGAGPYPSSAATSGRDRHIPSVDSPHVRDDQSAAALLNRRGGRVPTAGELSRKIPAGAGGGSKQIFSLNLAPCGSRGSHHTGGTGARGTKVAPR